MSSLHCGWWALMTDLAEIQFSVPQIEYPLGGSNKKCILPDASFLGNAIVLSNCDIF